MSDIVKQTAEEMLETPIKAAQEEGAQPSKKTDRIWLLVLAAIIAVIIAVWIGTNIYNSPQRRLARLLDLGNTYLDNGQYEEAALIFEQVIAIDARCVEAYAGGMEAYRNTDDTAGKSAFYIKALAAVEDLDEGLVTEKIDYVVEIYLAADDVYSFDMDRVINTLEKGYSETGENPRVRDRLVLDYLDIAKEGEYEDRLEIIDRLLELDEDNEEVQEQLQDVLTDYIGFLIEEEQYDKIAELTGRYDDAAKAVIEEYIEQYIDQAKDLETAGSYEESMAVYDMLLKLDGESGILQTAIQNFLQAYIDFLLQEGMYDEIRRLIEKYRELVPGMDFDAILAQIEAMEEEERARLAALERNAASTNSGQTAQGQQSQFSYDEIPLWIRSQEMTVFRTGVPSTWSDAQRAQYKAMWESLWGTTSWPIG